MQGTQVQPLVREEPTCLRTTKPTCHNYWLSPALGPQSRQRLGPRAATTEAQAPRARAPQQREAAAEKPEHCNYRKPIPSSEDPVQPKTHNNE